MSTLILSLLLFTLPAQAQEAPTGLKCEADANNPKDPYARMKANLEHSVRQTIVGLGTGVDNNPPRLQMVKARDGLNKYLGDLCTQKDVVETRAKEITSETSEAQMVSTGTEGCEKYKYLSSKIGIFNNQRKQFQASLDRAIKLQKSHSENYMAKDYALFKPHMSRADVVQSFRNTWGVVPGAGKPNENDRKTAIITSRIIQIEEEHKLNASRQEGYDNFTKSLNDLKAKCPSLIDPMMASAQRNGSDWGTMQLKPGDPGYVPPGTETTTTDTAPTDTSPADPSQNPGYVPPTPDPSLEGPVKTEREPGWIERNKGVLLIGAGTAAVVGGVLWYKNKQDQKAEDNADFINKQANAANATVTSTTTSTSTSTSTASTTKTLSVTGFPPSASTNYVIPTITATVTGANNDGIDITIACVSSCSLAGTLTKKTVNGKVEFNDLYFTTPHEGVQLRVTGTGLNSIASPGSFSVISSGRQ